jgi:transglutaminase-like putative cysteine protease
MHRWIAAIVIASACSAPVLGGEPKGKLVTETWDAAYLEGGKAGTVHITTHEMERAGHKFFRTTADISLRLKRSGQVVSMRVQLSTDETPDGSVLATFMRQMAGKDDLTIQGIIKGKQIEFLLNGQPDQLKPAPWDDAALGLRRQQTFLADKKIKPGDMLSFRAFEPQINLVITYNVKVLEYEQIDVPGTKTKQKLLRVETTPEKVQGAQLPKLVQWVDADLKPVRQDTELPFGKLVQVRTTKEIALAPGPDATLTDIGIAQIVRINKKVLQPLETTSSVWRITVQDNDDAASAFVQDARQKVKTAKGSTFEMEISASKGPKKGMPAAKVADEFLQSSYYITSADPKVKELAKKAVGKETDAWRMALAIEKWVFVNMRGTNDEGLAPASRVAKTLEGDCTEYAMLMAAMCRAQGIPSKTAIGLIYTDTAKGPAMAFHMWTEVWVQDQWIPLDATLGKGYVGAMHLKVSDHSWHDQNGLGPLLPLMNVLGKLQLELIEAR